MSNLTKLYKRLERVNTALNLVEDKWPWRGPEGTEPKPLKFSFDPARLAKSHVDAIRKEAERLAKGLPGWEVTVDIYAFTGQDAGCVINLFFNGSSAARSGVSIYNHDLGVNSKSYTPSLQACVQAWPIEVNRMLTKFGKYPTKTFASKRYKALQVLRRKLNTQWTKLASSMTPYPHGKHSPGWPNL